MAGKNKMRREKSTACYVYMSVFLFVILFNVIIGRCKR